MDGSDANKHNSLALGVDCRTSDPRKKVGKWSMRNLENTLLQCRVFVFLSPHALGAHSSQLHLFHLLASAPLLPSILNKILPGSQGKLHKQAAERKSSLRSRRIGVDGRYLLSSRACLIMFTSFRPDLHTSCKKWTSVFPACLHELDLKASFQKYAVPSKELETSS